jgi:uncharacterized protein YoxC
MTPTSDEDASLSVVLEMLRGIDGRLQSQDAASTEDRKLLHDIVLRVDRIERNQLERKVKDLEQAVDDLQSDRDRRRGITMAAEWVGKFGPSIILLIAAAVSATVYFRGH